MTIYQIYHTVGEGQIEFLHKTDIKTGFKLIGIGEDKTIYEPYIVKVHKEPYLFTMAIFDGNIEKEKIKIYGLGDDKFKEKIDCFTKIYEYIQIKDIKEKELYNITEL